MYGGVAGEERRLSPLCRLHYELKAGHSSGVSIKQLVDDYADEMAFLWNETAGTK
jgi:hypothetical protein